MSDKPAQQFDTDMLAFIEEHIDLTPDALLTEIQNKFGSRCANANCFCQAIAHAQKIYREHGIEELPEHFHAKLMNCLKNKADT